jgi:ribosomal protein S18 acetylase RimI-like enzyme
MMTDEPARVAAVVYRVDERVDVNALNELMVASWPGASSRDWRPVLQHSLATICAYRGELLIGFVHVAWDGGVHAFLLDPTVHPNHRRRGIGTELVRRAVGAARARGCAWLHVDYEASLAPFYDACGFGSTAAGLMRL